MSVGVTRLSTAHPQARGGILTRLAAELFPELPAADPSRRMRTLLTALLVILGAGLVSLLRQRGISALDTVWGEDGRILSDAATRPVLATLLAPAQGYLNLFPRLVGAVASAAPLRAQAAVLAGGCALVMGVTVWLVYRATAGHLRYRPVRLAVAAMSVFVPVASGETLNNTVNAQWYLAWAAFWMVLWRPTGRFERAVAAAVCLVAALSHPLLFLLVPLAVLRLLSAGRRWRDPVPWALIAGVVLQVGWSYLTGGATSGTPATTPAPASIAELYGVRVLLSAILGVRHANGAWLALHRGAVVLVALAVVTALSVAGYRRPAAGRYTGLPLVIVALACSAAWFVAPLLLRPSAIPMPSAVNPDLLTGGRYSYLPILLLLTAVAVALASMRARPDVVRTTVLALSIVVMTWAWWPDFRLTNLRSSGPSWQRSVAAAQSQCRTTAMPTTRLPQSPPPIWALELPCTVVLDRG